MLTEDQKIKLLKYEVSYHTSRSGGKGGQNVNKVETRVEIELNVVDSEILSGEQKEKIIKGYSGLIKSNTLKVSCDKHRTQLQNKEEAKQKLIFTLNKFLKPTKKRLATKPSKSKKEAKLKSKKLNSEKKMLRKKIY